MQFRPGDRIISSYSDKHGVIIPTPNSRTGTWYVLDGDSETYHWDQSTTRIVLFPEFQLIEDGPITYA